MASPGLTMGSFAGVSLSGGGVSINGRRAEKQDRCPGRAVNCWGSRTLERSRTTFVSVSWFCRTCTSLSYVSLCRGPAPGTRRRPPDAGQGTHENATRSLACVLLPCPAHGNTHRLPGRTPSSRHFCLIFRQHRHKWHWLRL